MRNDGNQWVHLHGEMRGQVDGYLAGDVPEVHICACAWVNDWQHLIIENWPVVSDR